MYSPTIKAGVNSDEDWFHTILLYMCKKSTTARAAWQATLRVRRTESPLVHCSVQSSISVLLDCAPEIPGSHFITPEEQVSSSTSRLSHDLSILIADCVRAAEAIVFLYHFRVSARCLKLNRIPVPIFVLVRAA
jgi:hypothetical protein